MNKIIRNLAIVAAFIFIGLPGFPQEVQQEEAPAAQPVAVENVAFPIFVPYPVSCDTGSVKQKRGDRTGLPRFRLCQPCQAFSSSWVITS